MLLLPFTPYFCQDRYKPGTRQHHISRYLYPSIAQKVKTVNTTTFVCRYRYLLLCLALLYTINEYLLSMQQISACQEFFQSHRSSKLQTILTTQLQLSLYDLERYTFCCRMSKQGLVLTGLMRRNSVIFILYNFPARHEYQLRILSLKAPVRGVT